MITFKDIKGNEKLLQFCNKIITFNNILNDETTKYMFIAGIVSSEFMVDKESCDESIELATFILNNIDLFMFNDDNAKEEIKNYMLQAMEVANRDKKIFEEQEKH